MRRPRLPAALLAGLVSAQALPVPPSPLPLDSAAGIRWSVRAVAAVPPADPALAQPCTAVPAGWVPAQVPGTVFAAHVAAGLVPDPNFGDNIARVDPAPFERPFWYRTEFTVPTGFSRGRLWLQLQGANRDAEVFLNGERLGEIRGIVQRGRFEVTDVVRAAPATNVLAVRVSPPRLPLANGASPTYGSSAGWDWMPRVPGLNGGLTDSVSLATTGDVSLLDPWVRTELPALDRALLTVQVDLHNAAAHETRGRLVGTIEPTGAAFELPVTLQPGETRTVAVDHRGFPSLALDRPALWWPNGYGEQPLHRCTLRFLPEGAPASDTVTTTFGIRRLEVDTSTRALRILVNGEPIFLRGGNWGMPEYLLRGSAADYETRVRLHRDMNFNMIRNWMGSTTAAAFYEACDRHGLLVWDDFWLNSSGGLPRDLLVFHANSIEKLKRLRNHPCIALWCGDNEGVPPAPLDEWLATNVRTFDGRHYQPNSHSGSLSGSGPWTGLAPEDYFLRAAPGHWGGEEGWGLRSEIGAAVVPNLDSLREFLPTDRLWPRNELWNRHFFGPAAEYAGPETYCRQIDERYGPPADAADFCRKAQLLNLETSRALFEGWRDNLWADATGVLLWMSQSAYPSMVWQTYDYYFDATGAYWGAKNACEPVHIQWNPGTDRVAVVNNTRTAFVAATAEARLFGSDGRERPDLRRTATLDLAPHTLTPCFAAPPAGGDLARGRPVSVSSVHVPGREGDKLTDGRADTRWESDFAAQPWAAVDLGEPRPVGRVVLRWQPGVHARVFKLQVSADGSTWRDAFYQQDGRGGDEEIAFPGVVARHVRLFCQEKATTIGVSLRAFEIRAPAETVPPGLHFLRLRLTDRDGTLLSENLYWRGAQPLDYRELSALPPAVLRLDLAPPQTAGDETTLAAEVSNPSAVPAVAIRIQVVDMRSGRRVLPILASDGYFTLLPGESRRLTVRFAATAVPRGHARLVLTPFNSPAPAPTTP